MSFRSSQIVAVLFFFAVASAAPAPNPQLLAYPSYYSSAYVPVTSAVVGRSYAPYYSSVYTSVPSVYSYGTLGYSVY